MIYRMPFLPIYLSTLLYDTLFHILYNDRPTESLIFFNSHQWDHKMSVFSENVFKLKTENVRNEAGDTAISLQHQSPPWEVPIWVGVGDILGKLRIKVSYSSMRSSNLGAGWEGAFLASSEPKSLRWHIIICWLTWFLTTSNISTEYWWCQMMNISEIPSCWCNILAYMIFYHPTHRSVHIWSIPWVAQYILNETVSTGDTMISLHIPVLFKVLKSAMKSSHLGWGGKVFLVSSELKSLNPPWEVAIWVGMGGILGNLRT